jgi:hypothetical protein
MALFPLGILSAAGAGAETYELISTTVLGGTAASVTFSSLGDYSSIYKHLEVRLVARSSRADSADAVIIRLNGDTGSNYAYHRLIGEGSGVFSGGATSTSSPQIGAVTASLDPANSFGSMVISILDTYSTTKNKTMRSLNGATGILVGLYSALHISTSATSSVQLLPSSGNFVTGSRFSLYGIRG